MRLHELYFGNLGGKRRARALDRAGREDRAGFRELRSLSLRAPCDRRDARVGWVVLFYDPAGDRLLNTWVGEHDRGPFVGGVPLLVMDVWEHAFLRDYGSRRAEYIDAFLAVTDWFVVGMRLQAGLECRSLMIGA